MTFDHAALRLATVLRAENDALAAGHAEAAAGLLPEKTAATAAMQAALQAPIPSTAARTRTAISLRDLADENRRRLELAIEAQGRIVEMVARAARLASPGPVRYGANGNARSSIGAVALALRA